MIEFRVVRSESLYFNVGDVVRIISDPKGGEITVQPVNTHEFIELFKILAGTRESTSTDEISQRTITEFTYPIVFTIDPTEMVGRLKLFILDNESIVFDLFPPKAPGDGGPRSGSGGGFKS